MPRRLFRGAGGRFVTPPWKLQRRAPNGRFYREPETPEFQAWADRYEAAAQDRRRMQRVARRWQGEVYANGWHTGGYTHAGTADTGMWAANAWITTNGRTYEGTATDIFFPQQQFGTGFVAENGTYPYTVAASTLWTATTNQPMPEPPRIRASARIPNQKLVALDGDVREFIDAEFDALRRQIEEEVGVPILAEYVWQQWNAVDDCLEIIAEWSARPRTEEAWLAWQSLPRMKRVYNPQSRRYEEITEAEAKRREWAVAQHALIIRNRGRATQLREKQAAKRAEALLLEHLTPQQASEWVEHKQFHVETANGRRCYRIKHGRAGNIYLVKDGRREAEPQSYLRRYCFHEYHPDGERVPVEDTVLAQKLMIECSEDEFLRVANVS